MTKQGHSSDGVAGPRSVRTRSTRRSLKADEYPPVGPVIPDPRAGDTRVRDVVENRKEDVFRWLSGRLGEDKTSAEDLTDDVFERLFIYWFKRGPLADEVAAWVLHVLARRRLADWFEVRGTVAAPTDGELLLRYAMRRVPDLAENAKLRAHVADVIRRLTDMQCKILALVHVDGMRHASAARAMGLSPDSFNYHLRAARARAKSLLGRRASTPTA